jgi:mannose-6-phosphate isomerase-like protein (cupin superfamily)
MPQSGMISRERQKMKKINLREKLSLFTEHWTPKIIGELNGQYVKLAKLKGDFIWHKHDDEDELFMILKGSLVMELRDERIVLNAGDVFIVPKGVDHKPIAEEEAHVMLFEPVSTAHTGDVESDMTVKDQEWI